MKSKEFAVPVFASNKGTVVPRADVQVVARRFEERLRIGTHPAERIERTFQVEAEPRLREPTVRGPNGRRR